jgi:hypothetical protein
MKKISMQNANDVMAKNHRVKMSLRELFDVPPSKEPIESYVTTDVVVTTFLYIVWNVIVGDYIGAEMGVRAGEERKLEAVSSSVVFSPKSEARLARSRLQDGAEDLLPLGRGFDRPTPSYHQATTPGNAYYSRQLKLCSTHFSPHKLSTWGSNKKDKQKRIGTRHHHEQL